MRQFITRFADKITGVLSGFDRLIFRGHLLPLCHEGGVHRMLATQNVLLKDFEKFAKSVTRMIRDAGEAVVAKLGRPKRYLDSNRISKEKVAKAFFAQEPIRSGPICLLSSLEPCSSWRVWRSREHKHPQELRRWQTKCLYLYTYLLDPELGFCHVRIQTYIPFMVQIYVNGREWLGRQLDRLGMSYRRADNCFPHLGDPERAQRIFDAMLGLSWSQVLDDLVRRANPALADVVDAAHASYYWTIHQSEWASDILFRDAPELSALYPALVRHAITDFNAHDVMRFLGRRLTGAYQGEVITDCKKRREGVRVKHWVGANSQKMYDRAHPVQPVRGHMPAALRLENTINDPAAFKTRRKAQGDPDSECKPRPLRKGIADMRRRARICQAANNRYGNALATASTDAKVHDVVTPITKPTQLAGRRARAMRPWAEPDLPLLRAIADGEFLLNGFRNRDLLSILFPGTPTAGDRHRKRSARISYLLRILRAHELIEKVAGTHRYLVTAKGRQVIAAVLATDQASISKLKECA